jgi:hypothetical protein
MIWWQMIASHLRRGKAWIKSSAFVLVRPSDFHPILHRLALKLIRVGLHEKSAQSRFIFVLHRCFTNPKRDRVVMSECEFRAHISGCLHLDIGQWLWGDNESERLIRSEDEFSILLGWYVSPWAQSILEKNSVDGLMLDTTWKVIHKYMTTIITAVYRNVGIPLEFAFGAAETVELYEQPFGAFNHLFGIDLSHCILESGQDSALCSLCTSKEQVQMSCLQLSFAFATLFRTRSMGDGVIKTSSCRVPYFDHTKHEMSARPVWSEKFISFSHDSIFQQSRHEVFLDPPGGGRELHLSVRVCKVCGKQPEGTSHGTDQGKGRLLPRSQHWRP